MKKKILILISIILTISLLANKNQEIDMQNAPTENIYNFNVSSLQGDEIDFNQFKGKVLLIVNTASKCGFTRQYKDLESLQQRFINDDLIIIGIP